MGNLSWQYPALCRHPATQHQSQQESESEIGPSVCGKVLEAIWCLVSRASACQNARQVSCDDTEYAVDDILHQKAWR